MRSKIKDYMFRSVENYNCIMNDKHILENLERILVVSVEAFLQNKKMLFCGNGGSAADAQHIAAELSGRFYLDRPPLYAEALHVNTSFLTAAANDFGYEETYARMLEACGEKGDILVGISTSGNSINVVKAIEKANDLGITTIGLTGNHGGKMADICDLIIKIPSNDTPRIQEGHILIGHIICQLIEEELFSDA